MCEPVTILAGLAAAGVALGATSAVQQGLAAKDQAGAQADIIKNQIRVNKYAATAETARGEVERNDIRERIAQLLGNVGTTAAANGILTSSGSVAGAIGDIAARGARDIKTSQYNSELAQWGFRNNQSNLQFERDSTEAAGTNALLSGGIGAASTLLKGAGEIGLMTYSPKPASTAVPFKYNQPAPY